MKKTLFLVFILTASLGLFAQSKKDDKKKQDAAKTPAAPAPAQDQRKLPLGDRNAVTLADLNVEITSDARVIAMMAALNAAGFDFEPGNRGLGLLRTQLREDLKNINPSLVRRLQNYVTSHSKGRIDASAVAPYLSLALTLTPAPSFSVDVVAEKLPEDVRGITDFALLLEEFYRDTRFGSLMPKYLQAHEAAAKNYVPSAVNAVANIIQYLHTEPVLELPPAYVPRAQNSSTSSTRSSIQLQNRVRRFVVMPDLLNASNAVNLRVVRDTFYVFLGANVDTNAAVRRGFIRFALDPIVDRQVKEVALIGPQLRKLRDSRGEKSAPEYKDSNAYFLIADCLTRAIDMRIESLETLISRRYADEKALKKAMDDEVERGFYELSFPYERGAVLVYHFYDQMRQAENAGIDIKQYLPSLLQNIKFDAEATRLTDSAQRIERYKTARDLAAKNAPTLTTSISNADADVVAKIDEADKLIRAEQFDGAKAVLKDVLKVRSNNARAYFGLAEISSKAASKMKNEDQSRRDEELYAAVQYYKDAADNASKETELWLIQRSFVSAAKILDFLGNSGDADAAFALAIKMGDIPNGAYQDAVKAVKEKETQKKP